MIAVLRTVLVTRRRTILQSFVADNPLSPLVYYFLASRLG